MTMIQTPKAMVVLLPLPPAQQMPLGPTTAGGGSQSTSDVRDYIEEACIALQVGDSQGAMMYMDMALSALSGNDTLGNLAIPPSEITNGTTTGADGVTTPAGSSAGTLSGGGT